eukprot:scaffold433782_cov39-Prasinocladus_malaysianus.AAC.1
MDCRHVAPARRGCMIGRPAKAAVGRCVPRKGSAVDSLNSGEPGEIGNRVASPTAVRWSYGIADDPPEGAQR